MSKYVVKMEWKEKDSDEVFTDFIECDDVEQFKASREELANEDLKLTLYELTEVNV